MIKSANRPGWSVLIAATYTSLEKSGEMLTTLSSKDIACLLTPSLSTVSLSSSSIILTSALKYGFLSSQVFTMILFIPCTITLIVPSGIRIIFRMTAAVPILYKSVNSGSSRSVVWEISPNTLLVPKSFINLIDLSLPTVSGIIIYG